jgi:hypothetical protein
MATFKKKDLNELVGGDMSSNGGDRVSTNNSEIETGPIQPEWGSDSHYEKGQSITTDKVTQRYRQDIPWFALYSFGGTNYSRGIRAENESKVINKKTMEERIEDLVKKSKNSDVTEKDYNPKAEKIVDSINDSNFNDKELEEIIKAIEAKKIDIKPKNI